MEESLKRLLKNSYSPYSGFRVAVSYTHLGLGKWLNKRRCSTSSLDISFRL